MPVWVLLLGPAAPLALVLMAAALQARLPQPPLPPPGPRRPPGRLEEVLDRAPAVAQALAISLGERLLAMLEATLLRVFRVDRRAWEAWLASRHQA